MMLQSFSFYERFGAWWHRIQSQNPVLLLVLIALIPRLLAAVFAKGYAMSDDHFTLEEVSWHWFLPNYGNFFYNDGTGDPPGHSIIYPFINHCLIRFSVLIGMEKPQAFMLVIRIVHALYSLLVVYAGYRLAEALAEHHEQKSTIAWHTGLALALFWLLPFMSVRNLIEMICIPPVMVGMMLVVRSLRGDSLRIILLAGMCFGIAFVFRYQTIVMTGMVGLLLLVRYSFIRSVVFGVGVLIVATLLHGITDWIIWGKPFAQFLAYTKYNALHGADYTQGPWYNYVLLVIGLGLPPVSFVMIYRSGQDFLRRWVQRHTEAHQLSVWLFVVLPAVMFIVVHSFYPNKQERFILPAVPLLLIAGWVAWHHQDIQTRWARWMMRWYWSINILLLTLFTFTYSKKARVETLTWLSEQNDVTALLVDGVRENAHLPLMYLYPSPLAPRTLPLITTENNGVAGDAEYTALQVRIDSVEHRHGRINYVLVIGQNDHAQRIQRLETLLRGRLQAAVTITPSLLDDIVYALNPKYNVNLTSVIYRVVP
jgi:hypothetical protein